MEHAKKMILVEPRVLESITRAQPVEDATNRDLKETTQAMDTILNSDVDAHDKANAYQQALWGFLQRYKQYKDRPLGKVELTSDSKQVSDDVGEGAERGDRSTLVEKDVLESVPNSLKGKAERLLQRLKSNPKINWNDQGELEINGRFIKRSNLTDLVNDVLRKRKTAPDPTGWEDFADVLRHSNVAQDLIGNPTRWNYIRGTPDTVQRKRFEFEDEEGYATPRGPTPSKTPKRGRLPWSTLKK